MLERGPQNKNSQLGLGHAMATELGWNISWGAGVPSMAKILSYLLINPVLGILFFNSTPLGALKG